MKEARMNISNMGQKVFYLTGQTGKILPTQVSNQNNIVPQEADKQKTIDLRNTSTSDINNLIKSGFDELLFKLPTKALLDGNGNIAKNGGYQTNESFDLIGQIEGMIEFRKSIGKPTENLEEALGKYNKIDGQSFPKSIDLKA